MGLSCLIIYVLWGGGKRMATMVFALNPLFSDKYSAIVLFNKQKEKKNDIKA